MRKFGPLLLLTIDTSILAESARSPAIFTYLSACDNSEQLWAQSLDLLDRLCQPLERRQANPMSPTQERSLVREMKHQKSSNHSQSLPELCLIFWLIKRNGRFLNFEGHQIKVISCLWLLGGCAKQFSQWIQSWIQNICTLGKFVSFCFLVGLTQSKKY